MILRTDPTSPITITSCPSKYIGEEIIDLIDLIDHAEAGRLPVAGGVLDQTASFRSAMNLFNRFKSEIREQQTHTNG